MANLNEQQTDILRQIEAARATYEVFESELNREVNDRKWTAKTDMRKLVRLARSHGVPFRQIGFALKTADHRTLKEYEQDIRRQKT